MYGVKELETAEKQAGAAIYGITIKRDFFNAIVELRDRDVFALPPWQVLEFKGQKDHAITVTLPSAPQTGAQQEGAQE